MKLKTSTVVVALAALLSLSGMTHATSHATGSGAHSHTALTDGEVRKVDKDAKKLTIRHGPIQNLDMPAMTMVFQVTDPALLDRVKAGDKIRFLADKIGGAYTLVDLEMSR